MASAKPKPQLERDAVKVDSKHYKVEMETIEYAW